MKTIIVLIILIVGLFFKENTTYNKISKSLLALFFAIVAAIFILPVSLIYAIVKLAIKGEFKKVGKYLLNTINKCLEVFAYIIMRVAVGIDILGNVVVEYLFEDIISTEDNTYFGDQGTTISASTGQLEETNRLTRTGKFFNTTLSFVLGKNHAINAWKKKIYEDKYSAQ